MFVYLQRGFVSVKLERIIKNKMNNNQLKYKTIWEKMCRKMRI